MPRVGIPRNSTNASWLLADSPSRFLVELYALLEDYAPTWYTEEDHDRAMSVLRALGLLEIGIDRHLEPSAP